MHRLWYGRNYVIQRVSYTNTLFEKMFNTINLSEKLIFNPSLRFKSEKNRCIAYIVDDFFSKPSNLAVLYPSEVIFLLLFDGSSSVVHVLKSYAYLFNIFYNSDKELIHTLREKILDIQQRLKLEQLLINIDELTPSQILETQNRYNIKEFIISDKNLDIDIENLRLLSPLSVNFNVTTVCGFKCKYCYHPLNPITDYISVDRLKIIFKELKDINCENVLLSGGDPMLRPDIDELIKALSDTNLYYTISTKSILEKDRIKKFYNEYGMKTIQISLDSINSDCVKYHLGIDDDEYVTKAIKMINTMRDIGIRVRIKTVVTKYSIETLSETLKAFADLGIENFHLAQYIKSDYRHYDNLFPTKEQLSKIRFEIEEFKFKNNNINFSYDNFLIDYKEPFICNAISKDTIFVNRGICNAERFMITLLPNGEVFICENLPYKKEFVLGDLREQSVMEYWNSDRVKEWLSPPNRNIFADSAPCKICNDKYYNHCHKIYSRCLKYCYETFNNVNMSDINCPYTKFKRYRVK